MNKNLVTIILPAHNAADTITEAIDSVLSQTHGNWELVIIENGSTDTTLERCRQFTDSRIRLMQHPRSGLSRARNIGLEMATGEFLCFLDADDLLPQRSIEQRLLLFHKNPKLSYCDGLVIKKNETLNHIVEEWLPNQPLDLFVEMNKINSTCFCGVTWMIRTSVIGGIRFDETWSHLEDRKFFYELSKQGQYAFVHEPIYIIRKRQGSLMTNHNKLQLAYRRFLDFIESEQTLSPMQVNEQRWYYKRMFFKTHLKSGRLLAAIKVFLEK